MRVSRASSRYAKALMDLAVETGEIEAVYKDMVLLSHTCNASKDLVLTLKSPVVKVDKKQLIFKEIFGPSISKLSLGFAALIIEKGRGGILHQIVDSFVNQYKAKNNIIKASVTSAIELPKKDKDKIVSLLVEAGKTIEMEERVDGNIIGGFIVRVGDQQIDNSVKSRLLKIGKELDEETYNSKL